MSFVQQIVGEVAAREGVGPLELDTPLEAAVDTDLLAAVTETAEHRRSGPYPVMEFEYYGYAVSVDAGGNVTVEGQSDACGDGRAQSVAALSTQSDCRATALKQATDVVAARERPFEERLDGLLEVVRKNLGVGAAALSYVDGGTYTFEAVDAAEHLDLQAGSAIPVAETACGRVVESEQSLVTGDLPADAPALTDTAFEVGTYLGVPVFADGDVYGTFCAFDPETHTEAFTEWDRAFLELLSRWVGSELEQRHRDRALHASTTERPYSR